MIDRLVVSLGNDDRNPVRVGELYLTAKSGKLVSSAFQYDTTYLARPDAFPVDPELALQTGAQYSNGLPGAMEDCAPDRWGRNLITKHRRADALAEGRKLETLTDADFLVGVSDVTRQGALRFRADDDGLFLNVGADVPLLLELPRLMRAADTVSRESDFGAIKLLLDAGSGSLGGARPKASVRDGERLLIAKFPHPDDEWDVMAWEKTALDLAKAAGIRVPDTKLARIDKRAVLLLGRFDRHPAGRLPYISGMTLLSARDGDSHDYIEIAEALPAVSSAATADLNELWRRVAFSILVNNTDDHLRNHGFLRESGGWRLSPVFDVNPNPDTATERQTSVGGADAMARSPRFTKFSREFDLSPAAAREALADVIAAVSTWRDVASDNGVNAEELELFADAFATST